MIVAAIIIAFLLDQIRPAESSHAAVMWLVRWIDAVARRMDASGRRDAWLAWLLAVAAPALAAALIGWLCTRAAGWFGELAWAVAVLYFTLGFRQFSYRYTAIRDALAAGDSVKARALLAQWHAAETGDCGAVSDRGAGQGVARDAIVRAVIVRAVVSAHRWVFAVLFWFCLLASVGFGPAGAVLYRCAEFAARRWQNKVDRDQPVVSPALLAVTQTVWHIIDWLPVRVTALTFAIVGNFEDAIAAWRRNTDGGGSSANQCNDDVLLAAAAGALGIRLDAGANAAAPSAQAAQPAAPVQSAPAQADAAGPVYPPYPPDWEPAALPVEGGAVAVAGASGLSGTELDMRHFVQVVGLLWRSVALWLLLLVLLTLAHVLG